MPYNFSEHLPFSVVMTVEQISQADDPLRSANIDQVNKNFEVVIICFCRHGDARLAEMVDLSEMQI